MIHDNLNICAILIDEANLHNNVLTCVNII